MPGSLATEGETDGLKFLTGQAATAYTTPLRLALTTTAPTATSAGTEVTGGSYTRQTVTLAAPTGSEPAATSNTALIEFAGMPAVGGTGVVGFNIYDSSATPRRVWFGTWNTAKTVNAGDPFQVPAGDLDLTIT